MKLFSKLVTGLTLITLATTSFSEKPEVTFATTKITDSLYMLSGVGGFAGGNIGLLTGADGVVLIDNSMPPMLDKLNAAIAKVTDNKPVDFLINTHIHLDHIGNNKNMKALGAHIIAHKNLRLGLINDDNEKTTEKDLPMITISENMSFYFNGEEAHVIHTADAHTDGDLFIHFKNANVIHTGDLFFNGLFPFIDLANGGDVNGYIHAQNKIIALSDKNTKIIPGHGPMATVADLQSAVDMLESSRDIIKTLIKEGKSEDDVVAINPLEKFHDSWNWGFITTEKMTRQVYKSLANSHKHAAMK